MIANIKHSFLGALGMGFILLASLNTQVLGQEQTLEEIIITATKMGGTLQETPIAISLLTGDELQESGIFDINDLPNIAPGVEVASSPFGPVIAIRGVTTTDSTPKGNEGIGYLIDGINVGRPTERAVAFFDLERVEVLRGPQGTLFGKATSGGVVNVLTRRPGDDFGGYVGLDIGNFNTFRANAAVDIPVNDNLKLRVALNSNNTDGWVEPVLGNPDFQLDNLNDEEDRAARVSAIFDISDSSSLFVTATMGDRKGRGTSGIPYGVFLNESGSAQRQAFGNFVEPQLDEDYWNITAEFTTSIGEVDLTYVGGFRSYSNDSITATTDDPTIPAAVGPPFPVFNWSQKDDEYETNSHELRLNGQSSNFDWVAGVNWTEEDLDESNHTWDLPSTPLGPPGLALDISQSFNGIHPINNTVHESTGVFGQVNYNLTDDLTLVAGARWSEDSVSRRGTFAVGPGPTGPGSTWPDAEGNPCVAPADCIGGPNNADQEDDTVTWRLGLDYNLNETGMLYGSVATGYKAGGFSDFGGPGGGPAQYEPEDLTAYEIGYKGDITEALTYNTSLYYYDYEEMQLSYLQVVPGSGIPVIFTVTAPTEISGWENELTWRIDDESRVDFELQLMDSEYVDFDAGLAPPLTSWDGLELDSAPELVTALAYNRDFVLDSGATITGRIRTKYSDGYTISDISSAFRYEQDSFTRTDINLTYRSADDALSFGLYVRNLEDDLQVTSISGELSADPAIANRESVNVNRPRTFGMTIRHNF